MRTVVGGDEKTPPAVCAEVHGFSLHARVRCGAHRRRELERLCRYITHPAIGNERLLQRKAAVSNGSNCDRRLTTTKPAIALGKARKRRNYDELAKPFDEIQLVEVQPGQSRSGQAGSESCHLAGRLAGAKRRQQGSGP